jgi:phosphotransferase system  glucose/maltose/N-acetylglucosamine-specific IIC component
LNGRLIFTVLAVLIVCLPIAFIVTILLSPLWSWIEATYGIESIGHSGPSDWCFYLVYGVVATGGLLVAILVRKAFRA